MIKAILFSTFDPHLGPTLLHEVPPHSISPRPAPTTSSSQYSHLPEPLFTFQDLVPYLIPRQALSSRPIAIVLNHHRVIGHPVCIRSPTRYARNEFMFNFAIVLEEDVEFARYLNMVRKVTDLFRTGEEQRGWLTGTAKKGGRINVGDVCEMIMEDLNNYGECMIPIDDADILNIKLFPLYPDPPPVKPWYVPLQLMRLQEVMDKTWDVTMKKIVPHIDGVNTVQRISELADADYDLVAKCIQHLLYYRTLELHPPFTFLSIYAPTPLLPAFLDSPSLSLECMAYTASTSTSLPASSLFALYCSLHPRQTLKKWYQEHRPLVEKIDVRRFISFGMIIGLIHKVQRYAVGGNGRDREGLGQLLDGMRSFDEWCAEKQVGEKAVLKEIKSRGDVLVLTR